MMSGARVLNFRAQDGLWRRADVHGPASGPTVLLVLPCGIREDALAPWIAAVSAHCRVLTLQTRHILDADQDLALDVECGADAQVGDVLALAQQVSDHHPLALAGYCTGANVVWRALGCLDRPAAAAVLANGAFHLDEASAETGYERDMGQVLRACAAQPRLARPMHGVLKQRASFGGAESFRDFTTEAFRDLATFQRYVKVTAGLFQTPMPSLPPRLSTSVLLVHGLADDMVSPCQSQRMAATYPHAVLEQPPADDHYAWCRSDSVSLQLSAQFLVHHLVV